MHFYPFNIKDWALHTAHLSLEEEGAYRRLLDMYYDTERPIPKETQPVIRRLRLGSYVSEVEQVLSEFFDLEDDGYHNSRADIEINDYQNRVSSARKNGKKGGRPRKNKGVKTQPVNSANPEITEPKANQELEPVTSNQEPVTNSDVVTVSAKPKPRAKFSRPDLTEVYEYLLTRGIDQATARIESEKFTDYYSSNGWKVGKNAMKCWKAAVRNWTKNINKAVANNGTQNGNQPRKSSMLDRVKQQAADRLRSQEASAPANREFSMDAMAETVGDVRLQIHEPVRRDAGRDMDNVLNGDYWQTNG